MLLQQVNYLGPYVFTRLLEDSLVAGAPSRVIDSGPSYGLIA